MFKDIWWISGVVGFMVAVFMYEADIMWLEQGFAFGVMGTFGVLGLLSAMGLGMHRLYVMDNPGVGLVRLSIYAAMTWCFFTLVFFGDSTIVGIWYIFYLTLSLGVLMTFGVWATESFGVRLRVDVFERKNFSAALFIAAFTFATGLIWGGSMWGESTPESMEFGGPFMVLPSYEDGWWIIPWFFLMGWGILFLTMQLWFLRERSVSGAGIRRDRDVADGKAAALYCLGCAIPLTDAVAGDYYGMEDSLIGFAVIALPVLGHELMRPTSAEQERERHEPAIYIALGFAAMLIAPILSGLLGFR